MKVGVNPEGELLSTLLRSGAPIQRIFFFLRSQHGIPPALENLVIPKELQGFEGSASLGKRQHEINRRCLVQGGGLAGPPLPSFMLET